MKKLLFYTVLLFISNNLLSQNEVVGDFNLSDGGTNRDLRVRLNQKAAIGSYDTQNSNNDILYINRDWAGSYHSDYNTVAIYGNIGIGKIAPKAKLDVQSEYGTINFSHPNPQTVGILSTVFPQNEVFNLDSKYVGNWHKIAGLFISSNSSNNYSNYGILGIGKSNGGTEAVGGSFGAYNFRDNRAIGIKITNVESPSGESFAIYDGSGAKSYFSGNMGIGTTTPAAKLNIKQTAGNWNAGIRLSLDNHSWDIVSDNYGERLLICQNQDAKKGLAIKNGNVAIYGKLETTEIKVTETPTADFVFEEDYDLKKLEEIEVYIKENKHLPEIPSAKEMEKNGLDLAEMDIKLLQKIEELTLYLIELNKKTKEQSEKIKELKSEAGSWKLEANELKAQNESFAKLLKAQQTAIEELKKEINELKTSH
jgi:hypothetical protein